MTFLQCQITFCWATGEVNEFAIFFLVELAKFGQRAVKDTQLLKTVFLRCRMEVCIGNF